MHISKVENYFHTRKKNSSAVIHNLLYVWKLRWISILNEANIVIWMQGVLCVKRNANKPSMKYAVRLHWTDAGAAGNVTLRRQLRFIYNTNPWKKSYSCAHEGNFSFSIELHHEFHSLDQFICSYDRFY